MTDTLRAELLWDINTFLHFDECFYMCGSGTCTHVNAPGAWLDHARVCPDRAFLRVDAPSCDPTESGWNSADSISCSEKRHLRREERQWRTCQLKFSSSHQSSVLFSLVVVSPLLLPLSVSVVYVSVRIPPLRFKTPQISFSETSYR